MGQDLVDLDVVDEISSDLDQAVEDALDEQLETETLAASPASDGAYMVEVINFDDAPMPESVDLTSLQASLDNGFLMISLLLGAILGYLVSKDIVRGMINLD